MANDSLLQTLLSRATAPLTTLPSKVAGATFGPMTNWGMANPGLLGTAAKYGGAFGESVGNVLSDLTSPASLALTAATGGMGAGAARGVMGAARPAVGAARGLAEITPELVQGARAVKQVMPMADDVTRLAAQLKQRLLQVPSAGQRVKTLGQTSAEFTPRGGESALNATRSAMTKVASPASKNVQESMYKRMMSSGAGNMGGAMSEAGAVDPRLVVGGGAAIGGGYAAKKLYDLTQNIKSPTGTIQKANPFNRVSEILDEAGK